MLASPFPVTPKFSLIKDLWSSGVIFKSSGFNSLTSTWEVWPLDLTPVLFINKFSMLFLMPVAIP